MQLVKSAGKRPSAKSSLMLFSNPTKQTQTKQQQQENKAVGLQTTRALVAGVQRQLLFYKATKSVATVCY